MKKDKFTRLLLVMVAILLFAASTVAASQTTQSNPLGITSVGKMIPNGEYEVYVLTRDKWQQAGKIVFDKFFRESELDISSLPLDSKEVKIKIVQKGGGAAHIDAVLLGDRPPVEVKGIEDVLALKKLSKKDFDIVDAFEKSIEMTFPTDGDKKILSLTARVEGTRISEIPFQFPLSNLYKDMTVNSEFYQYRLADTGGGIENPFFKEYCQTGSGHPSGYTYGWVNNDNQNLYVRIDFTPDDTMDGEKDYAKVYAKTEEGIREFKESVPETKWGNPDFAYTDKVEYQHKVYDFTIPLKDVGIKDIKEGKELLLAFAAYGTAIPPPHITVYKQVVCEQSGPTCSDFGAYPATDNKSASGVKGDTTCPAFCYRITVLNDGTENLVNVTVNDPTISLTSCSFPTILAVGQSATCTITGVTQCSNTPNTVTASGQGSSSGTPVSDTDTVGVTVGTLSLDSSLTLTSAVDLDGVPMDNHVTLPGGSTNIPVTVAVTLTNSGDADQNVSITLPGLVNCLDLVTPVIIPSPIAFLGSGASATIQVGCLLTSCPAGTNLTVPAVGSAVASTKFPCVYDKTGTPVTVTTTFGGQVSCQPLEARCRTAGFWGTHAGTECPQNKPNCGSQNITGAVLNKCDECLEICGEIINNTATNDADSALEAMCVTVKGAIESQLARQLTALSLNCCISGFDSDCDGNPSLRDLFYCCNHLCGAPGTPCNETVQSCIDKIDCTNNGGVFLTQPSNCCEEHVGGGCDNIACQNIVCAVDPDCCEGTPGWDFICDTEAAQLCGTLCRAASNCCQAHDTPGCKNAACQAAVCAQVPSCCTGSWGYLCDTKAHELCGSLCDVTGCRSLPGNCSQKPLCNESLDLCFDAKQEKIAGSANACNTAIKSACGVLPPGEFECHDGTKEPDAEACARVEVSKTGDTLSKVGDPVNYTITIHNASSVILYKDDIADNLLGAITSGGVNQSNSYVLTNSCGASLAPDDGAPGGPDECIITLRRTVLAGDPDPLPNTVRVVYNRKVNLSGSDVIGSADWSVNLFQPSVAIENTGDELSKIFDWVTYSFKITNKSSQDSPDLNLASISDNVLGDLTSQATAAGCDVLAYSEVCTFQVTRMVQAGDGDPLINTVDVLYHPVGFPNNITASDSHLVNLFQPSISITKYGDELSKIGENVTYHVKIENTSSSDSPNLALDSVSDNLLGDLSSYATGCASLATGASCEFDVPWTVAAVDVNPTDGQADDPVINTVTIHFHPDGFPNDLTATASHELNLFQPSIAFSKTADTDQAATGEVVNYTLTLNNTSSPDTPNLVCTITDDKLGVNKPVTLASGEGDVTNVVYTVLASDPNPLVNTASVSCSPTGFPNVLSASSSWSVQVGIVD